MYINVLTLCPFRLCPRSGPEICEAPVFVGVLLTSGNKIMKGCPRLKTAALFAIISDLCCDMKSPINLKIAQLIIKTTSKVYFIYCFQEDYILYNGLDNAAKISNFPL